MRKAIYLLGLVGIFLILASGANADQIIFSAQQTLTGYDNAVSTCANMTDGGHTWYLPSDVQYQASTGLGTGYFWNNANDFIGGYSSDILSHIVNGTYVATSSATNQESHLYYCAYTQVSVPPSTCQFGSTGCTITLWTAMINGQLGPIIGGAILIIILIAFILYSVSISWRYMIKSIR